MGSTRTPHPPVLVWQASSPQLKPATMSGKLMMGIASMIDVFDQYAKKDGKGSTLSKGELKQLLEAEMGMQLKNAKGDEVNKLMEALDADKSGEVDFKEFMVFVASMSMLCHEHFCCK